uniref:hypothetical protein n=1 Tax=Flexibacterium corallicola TaxID=3037259 RepID=UPI00286F80BD
MLTLGQAAKEAGVVKSTISKAIKDGRISAQKLSNGSYSIDPAELFRVFPKKQSGNTRNGPLETPETNIDLLVENRVLKERVEALNERVNEKDQALSDLRSDRDHWRSQATGFLEDRRARPSVLQTIISSFRRTK